MFPRTRQPRMERMDKVIRMYTKFDDIKADEYRYWRRRPVHERTDAVEKMNPDHRVRYPIAGGYSVTFDAQPRFTNDIDPLIKAGPV